jgi:hypothetical protein
MNVSRKLLLHLLLILPGITFLAGCAGEPSKPPPRAFSSFSKDDREMYEAVFDYMFARWTGLETDTPEKFYLELNDADAPTDLLSKYRRKGLEVSPASRYRPGNGVKCSAGAIARPSATQARIFGGYKFGDVGEAWGTFELINEWGIWRVAKWQPKVQ